MTVWEKSPHTFFSSCVHEIQFTSKPSEKACLGEGQLVSYTLALILLLPRILYV